MQPTGRLDAPLMQIFSIMKKNRVDADAAEPAGPGVPSGIQIPIRVEEPVKPDRQQGAAVAAAARSRKCVRGSS